MLRSSGETKTDEDYDCGDPKTTATTLPVRVISKDETTQ